MTQATYSIRLDQNKKTQFDDICERLGLSASAAISTFVYKTVEERGIPYELRLEPAPSDFDILELDKLSHDELVAEAQKGIDSAERGETYTVDEVFGELAENWHARI